MTDITFITGNQNKADYLAKYLGVVVSHKKIDLDEIQSLSLSEIVEHKVKQAFDIVQKPVLVEDVSLEFEALGGLPGPFIKFFVEQMPLEKICTMVNNQPLGATARCVFGYYDGQRLKLVEGSIRGSIARKPAGDGGFGWDKIFIPDGFSVTRAQMDEEDYEKVYKIIKPVAKLKKYLQSLN